MEGDDGMKIEGVNNNCIMMAMKELEACNWLITGEIEASKRAGETCFILSGWSKKEVERLEKLRSNLNLLKFHVSGRECDKITYGARTVTTRTEYEVFVEEYTKTIQSYRIDDVLCIRLNCLLRYLSQAI